MFLTARQEQRRDEFRKFSEDMPTKEYDPACDEFNREEAPQEAVLQSDAARFRHNDPDEVEASRRSGGYRMPLLVRLIARHHGYTSCRDPRDKVYAVSYTHLTLPTKRIV